MKKILSISFLVMALGVLTFAASTHLVGTISDSKCGNAKHNAACVQKCIAGGASPVLVTRAGKTYTIANADSVKGYEAKRVRVAGTVSGDNLTVTSIHALRRKHAAKHASSM
jgi:hypothetical protein